MKTSNRIPRNSGKKATLAQSAKSEEQPPQAPVSESTDTAARFEQAVLHILQSNKTRHGLTIESILEFLPSFGFTAEASQVRAVLDKLARAGSAHCLGEFWFYGPEHLADISMSVKRSAILVANALDGATQPLSEEAILELLTQRHVVATVQQVSDMLDLLERLGIVDDANGWSLSRSDFASLRGLLPICKVEEATQRAGAVLELLRCKLIADSDTVGVPGSAGFDELKSQRLCGLDALIDDAENAINAAYTAEVTFTMEFRRLAGKPD